jgi:hypothetical protein
VQKGAEADVLSKVIDAQGNVDMGLLVSQIQAQVGFTDDLATRVKILEKRDYVSPDSVSGLAKVMGNMLTSVQKLEAGLMQTDLQVKELQEAAEKTQTAIAQLDAMSERIAAMEAVSRETIAGQARIEEGLGKCTKDVIGARATINTLRGNVQEAKTASEDAKKRAGKFADQIAAADARVKKVAAFVQAEVNGLTEKINDNQVAVDRSEDRLEELGKCIEQLTEQMQRQLEAAANRSVGALERPPMAEAQTEPHIPTPTVDVIVEKPFENPKPEPEPEPERIEQPVVTVVKRKNFEMIEAAPILKPKPLPRLGTSQAKRDPEALRSDLRRFEDLIPRVKDLEATIVQIKAAIDHVSKITTGLGQTKAEKTEMQTVFQHFKFALGELNNSVGVHQIRFGYNPESPRRLIRLRISAKRKYLLVPLQVLDPALHLGGRPISDVLQ